MRSWLLLGLLISPLLEAQDDDLQEATGLTETPATLPQTGTGFKLPAGLSERSYLWLEGTQRKAARDDWQDAEGPNAEASLSVSYQWSSSWQSFIDGRFLHDSQPKMDRAVLEQVGVRWQAQPHLMLALGKERSRKAPGLIIAPSDFLYSQENLPGQREQRSGLWQARIAWQESDRSLEFLVLPYDRIDSHGWPERDAHWNGWALRAFRQFANFDLQLSTGHLADGWHGGFSTQGIVGVWKVYAEAGVRQKILYGLKKERGDSALTGVEYQGSDKWAARAEYFIQSPAPQAEDLNRLWQISQLTQTLNQQKPGVTASDARFQPFVRRSYMILSGSGLALADRYNSFVTWIRSLEDRGFIGSVRGEWLADDHQVLGLSLLALSEGDHQQYALRPFDRQLSLDWKFTF